LAIAGRHRRIFGLTSTFQDSSHGIISFHSEKCCHLAREHDASGQHQFLNYSTLNFVHVYVDFCVM